MVKINGAVTNNCYLSLKHQLKNYEQGVSFFAGSLDSLSLFAAYNQQTISDSLKNLEQILKQKYQDKPLRKKISFIREYITRVNYLNYLDAKETNEGWSGNPMALAIISGENALLLSMEGSGAYLIRDGVFSKPTEGRADYLGVPLTLKKGDILVLCSYELTELLDQQAIAEELSDKATALEMANALRNQLATNQGDDISLMVLRIDDLKKEKKLPAQFISSENKKKYLMRTGILVACIALGFAFASFAQFLSKVEWSGANNNNQEKPAINAPVTEAPPSLPPDEPELEQPVIERIDEETPVAYISYEVKAGDTLYSISMRKYNRNVVEQIKDFNGLTNDSLRIGQIIKLPNL